MSFVINNMQIFSNWSLILNKSTDCTICRQSLNNPSIYSKEKGLVDFQILSSICGHSFHLDCIDPWLIKNKHCPNCSRKWETVD